MSYRCLRCLKVFGCRGGVRLHLRIVHRVKGDKSRFNKEKMSKEKYHSDVSKAYVREVGV